MSLETVNLRWNTSSQRLEEETSCVRSTERFLQLSQAPLDWFEKAARLPGKALAVGLGVWALAIGMKKSYAQSGKYPAYLNAANRFDHWVSDYWTALQAMPKYRGKT